MERKTQSRIPPPNKRKNTTTMTSNADRKSLNQNGFEPPLQPVFASVHRPRHQTSSVATVKRSNQTTSASHSNNSKLQQNSPYNPQNYIKDCQNENNSRIFNQAFMPMSMPVQIPHPNYGPSPHGSFSSQHQNPQKRTIQQQNNNLKQNINQKIAPSPFHPLLSVQNQTLINVNSKIPTTSHPQFNQITRMTTNLLSNCDIQQPTSSSSSQVTTTMPTLQHKFNIKTKDNVYEPVKHNNYHIYEQIDHHKRTNRSNETNNLNRPKNLALAQQQQTPPMMHPLPHTRQSYNFSNVPLFNPELLKFFQGQIVQNLSPIDERGNGQLGMNLMMETAQVLATAAYVERAAQRITTSSTPSANTGRSRNVEKPSNNVESSTGYCGALLKSPPLMPAGLARKLASRENSGAGKVKVMLRVSDNPTSSEKDSLSNFMNIDKKKRQVMLSDTSNTSAPSTERGPMVSAPKMFAFDSLFTAEDSQYDVCGSALSEAIPAVLEGSDACLLSFGYPRAGHSKTMIGSLTPNDLGVIPCAISWLFKGINEKRQKTGSRFSVRVSALGVNATKPGSSARDLLAGYATDTDESPGMYLKDDLLGGVTELRAPTADKAASYFDAALLGRHQTNFEPALIFTLHVYQYTVSGKGGVAGGRSRLHLVDLGGCANRSGGIPLSGFGNVLLAILSGQRHPPNRDHPLTPLLKDCLAPLTCHVAIIAHVSHSQTHTDTLTTIQVATRIHRMRRRKHRNPLQEKSGLNSSHQNGSSSGPDPSSSDLSQDTVIYMGPSTDDATDGEHPPVYHPSFSAEDKSNLSKALKKCEESPVKKPALPERNISIKFNESMPVKKVVPNLYTAPKIVGGALRYGNKESNNQAPKPSPLKRPATIGNSARLVNEQWIDGPNAPVAEHRKSVETWIDGPKSEKPSPQFQPPKPATVPQGYGFMDGHKKSMIRQWVENQSCQISHLVVSSQPQPTVRMNPNFRESVIGEESNEDGCSSKSEPINNKTSHRIKANDSQSEISSSRRSSTEEDQDSGPSEVPPALPLMNPLASREVSMESLHKLALEAVERGVFNHNDEDQCSQINEREHPLSALSQGDFSVVSSFHNGMNFEENSVENARHHFAQLARLREIFTSQLALAEVNPNPFNIPDDIGSVYSEPAYRFNADKKSLRSQPVFGPSFTNYRDRTDATNLKRSASETSLPSLNGIVTIAGMEQFASLRHPDGASDPDLPQLEVGDENDKLMEHGDNDSGLDTTPQTSKLSGISRRAESGYHSVGTGRDSDLCSIKSLNYIEYEKQKRREKSLCQWLRSCTHPDEDSERETTDL